MMDDMSSMGWFGPGFGWIFMFLWWGLIIVGIVALVRWLLPSGRSDVPEKSALNILKERYARGEVNREEFEEIRKGLEQ